MGQRHQAFIIARSTPEGGGNARYQSLGALHHQWCSGLLPLKAAQRFMTLIKQPDNAEVIREELRTLGDNNRKSPCPFTQFLFESSWSVDLNSENSIYARDCDNLWANITLDECDNENGFTVIDITDLENASYCFFLDADALTPISAEEYIRDYYSTEDEEGCESIRNLVQGALLFFVDVPLIVPDVLEETWKYRSYRRHREEIPATVVPRSSEVPSLVALTFIPAVEQAIIDNNIDVLDTLVLDPDKASIIENLIRPKNPVPDSAFRLLLKLLCAHKKPRSRILDLTGFNFSGEQIIHFVREYADVQKLDVDILKLSNNDQMNIDALRRILAAFPVIRRLVLFNTAITDAELIALVRDEPELIRHIEGLIHPAFLNVKPNKTLFTPAFTYLTLGSYSEEVVEVSLPFFTPNSLVQALTDYMRLLNEKDKYMPHTHVQAAMAAFATESRQMDKSWYERTVPFVPSSLGRGQWILIIVDGASRFLRNEAPKNKDVARCRNNYAFIHFNKKPAEDVDVAKATDGSLPFDLYDIRAFFKELELDGRPVPDHESLEQLCGIYTTTARLLSYEIVIELLNK